MLIPNYLRSDRSESSSLRSQAFRAHRPLIKAKLRSIIPTVSSLLEEDYEIEIPDYEIVGNTHLMEDQSKTHEISKRPNTSDCSKALNHLYDLSELRSHRTEDISIREDEDGIRSHICPLSESRDGAKFYDESTSDEFFIKGCNLRSEDITCQVAEKPPLSESEEESEGLNEGAWGYDIRQKRESTCDVASLELLLRNKFDSPPRNEKTEPSWLEESSDDEECNRNALKVGLLQEVYTNSDESDLEEFMEASANVINDLEKITLSSEDEQKSETHEEEQMVVECQNGKVDEENDTIYTEVEAVMGDNCDTSAEKIKLESSLEFKAPDENNLLKSHSAKSELEHFSESLDDGKKIDDVLKAIVEHAVFNATINLQETEEQTLRNPSKDLSNVTPITKIEAVEAEDNLLSNIKSTVISETDKLTETGIISEKERHCKNPEEHEPRSKCFTPIENLNKDHLTQLLSSGKNDAFQNDEKKDNLTMEPMDIRSQNPSKKEGIQPDLATALRFMTEVYPSKDEDELYSDTFSTSDPSSATAMKDSSIKVVIFRNYQEIKDEQSTPKPNNETPSAKSTTFEPAHAEDERAVGKRPKNKLSKFLQSFKKRLARKE